MGCLGWVGWGGWVGVGGEGVRGVGGVVWVLPGPSHPPDAVLGHAQYMPESCAASVSVSGVPCGSTPAHQWSQNNGA